MGETATCRHTWWGEGLPRRRLGEGGLPTGLLLFAKVLVGSVEFTEIRPNCVPSRGAGYATFKKVESHLYRRLSGKSHLRRRPVLGPARRRLGIAKQLDCRKL
jgi:hypothetical protein